MTFAPGSDIAVSLWFCFFVKTLYHSKQPAQGSQWPWCQVSLDENQNCFIITVRSWVGHAIPITLVFPFVKGDICTLLLGIYRGLHEMIEEREKYLWCQLKCFGKKRVVPAWIWILNPHIYKCRFLFSLSSPVPWSTALWALCSVCVVTSAVGWAHPVFCCCHHVL